MAVGTRQAVAANDIDSVSIVSGIARGTAVGTDITVVR